MAIIRLRALGQLGRAAQAESLLAARWDALDPVTRGDAVRAVAWAWVRMGDVPRARETLAKGGEESDERSAAWMALYEGDLKTARSGLRRLDDVSRDAVLALSVLARTRGEKSEGIGRAFLALARSDTAAAAKEFESTAKNVFDASPTLLSIAARLYRSTSDSARSEIIWDGLGQGPSAVARSRRSGPRVGQGAAETRECRGRHCPARAPDTVLSAERAGAAGEA